MLGGVDTRCWSLSAGSSVANEVVNSALMSGFTVTTSEVKPSELHILPICRGVGGWKRGTDAADVAVSPKRQGGDAIKISWFKNVYASLAAESHDSLLNIYM